jgi:RNA polymerase sigma-70 factor, ECF subfamily
VQAARGRLGGGQFRTRTRTPPSRRGGGFSNPRNSTTVGDPRKPSQPPSAEQTAFIEQAIEQYGKATYNFAYRLVGNEADAHDLTQDAFIRVYRAWRSFQPGTSFLSWIYRIVTNLYRDELRRRKGRFQEEIPDDNVPQEFGGQRPLAVDPIEDYVHRQLSEPLSRSLRKLSPDQRQVIILADIEEYSYQEIADIMGCSIGTVRSRLHRARALLRRLVQQEYERSQSR